MNRRTRSRSEGSPASVLGEQAGRAEGGSWRSGQREARSRTGPAPMWVEEQVRVAGRRTAAVRDEMTVAGSSEGRRFNLKVNGTPKAETFSTVRTALFSRRQIFQMNTGRVL